MEHLNSELERIIGDEVRRIVGELCDTPAPALGKGKLLLAPPS
jgi:hypothetical protein